MQTGDTKSFREAVITFFIVAVALQLADFGSYYCGRYGFSAPTKGMEYGGSFIGPPNRQQAAPSPQPPRFT